MKIKVCLPQRKRPMALEDLPDLRTLAPVGWWQIVSPYTNALEVRLLRLNFVSARTAQRQRTADGWGEWKIGKDFAARLAKFQFDAPWTEDEVWEMRGSFRCVVFEKGSVGFSADHACDVVKWQPTPKAAFYATAAAGWMSYHPRLIIDEYTGERLLEVTP